MKKIKTYVAMAVASVMMLTFAGCNIIERTEESIQKTVYAKVGDSKITKADVDRLIKPYLDQYKQQYGSDFENNDSLKEQIKNLRKQSLDNLVQTEVLYQSAKDLDVTPSDDEVQAKVDEQIKGFKDSMQTEDAYKQWLENLGFDEDGLNAFLKKTTVAEMVDSKIKDGVEISDEDIQNDYESKKGTTYTKQPGADVTHLLFKFEKDASGNEVAGTEEAALAKAKEARKKAVAGTSLSDLANSAEYKQYSTFEDLGHLSFEGTNDQGQAMVKEFTEGFKNLPEGQISEPVKTSFGYHVIKNVKVYKEATVTPLDDKLKEKIKSDLKQTKGQEAVTSKVSELKDKLKVKTYEDKF